ncbi:MAG: EamA family transporter [Anaerolineaceae bacterium]|nr:EamA family transporter [Anaerolineaceae bacterium]
MTSNAHLKSVLQALLVTFLWSTSWVLIKIGLQTDLPALTFAGLRYTLAFLCLLPFALISPTHRSVLRSLPKAAWSKLILLGIVFYTLTQGAQFVSLSYLPAATVTLLISFTPVLVASFSGLLNKEAPSTNQWMGILLSTLGVIIYFLPLNIPARQIIGLLVALGALVANSAGSLLGRQANHQSPLPPILITTISMGIGGILLLAAGGITQGFGHLNFTHWLIIVWLAVVNTAFAFTLWNRTLRALTAVESSIINNTMLPQITILAWVFLGESLNLRQIVGITLVTIGVIIGQLRRTAKSP